ncbi:SGNH/GDSL hydrolase family protein [Tianweitania sediminis]|uniref:SGNH/GDSL hydrolase family protein n=1 Tax=Tianweitania sediminis TaxID=1502156 RepID=A0A8J7UKD5_9HYPH|nr:SGNH/GDSL hydrolase family protein [Tianweitania sediminis]MBP0439574.1 SGNH/GDSL hydrolase family protein [Tianweitania sediminis]
MADWPGIYRTGTATVEEGGLTVTFQNAGNLVQAVRPGDRFGGHRGLLVRIAAVDATTITLAVAWPGPAQVAEPYEITFTPYDSGYRQALQTLLAGYDVEGMDVILQNLEAILAAPDAAIIVVQQAPIVAANAEIAMQAKDAALAAAGPIFPSEAVGRAAVADGEVFRVLGTPGSEKSIRQFTRTNSSTSDEGEGVPSTTKVGALEARQAVVETVVSPQVETSVYEAYTTLGADVDIDADERVMRRVTAVGYEYLLPLRTRLLEANRQILGGREYAFLDADEYALSGYSGDVHIDADFRIMRFEEPAEEQAGAVPLRRGTLRGAIIGDSRTANAYTGVTKGLLQPRAYPFWLQLYSKGAVRVPSDWNFGAAGETTTQILARLPGALVSAAEADFFIVMCETNDAVDEDSIGNIDAMVAAIVAAGKMAWIVAELPRGDTTPYVGHTWTTQRVARHLRTYNRLLRLAENPNVRVIDAWPDLVDPASSIGAPQAGLFYDALHLTCEGARRLGSRVWQSVSDLARTPVTPAVSAADVYSVDNPLGNLIPNGMMLGTGGVKTGTGTISGSVADGWTLNATASYAVTASKEVRDGFEGQKIVFTGTAINGSQLIALSRGLSLANFSLGDVLELVGQIEVDAGSVGMYGPDLNLNVNGTDTALSVGYQPAATATSSNPSASYGGPFISTPFIVPADLTSLAVAVTIKGKSGEPMSGTFWVSRLSLRKI